MDWNTKWEWKNHDICTSKVITTTPKKLQSANWEEDINESFNLSASDVANYSSAKSSISASTGSSLKEGTKMSRLINGEFIGAEVNGKSSLLEASVSSGEPFIGLKLGKRTYFENNFGTSNSKTSSFSDMPVLPVSSTGKKAKSSYCQRTPLPRCQVEGCNLDLSSAKDYHRKHRVCESHSKCPKVVVSGIELRFCQQCSRFHSLAEFDEKKRSCRRRLSDHNARRRKPRQETIRFNSTNLSSSFYGGQQLSFQSRPAVSSTWKNSSNSTYSIATMKTKQSGILDGISQLPNTVNMTFSRPVPSKGTSVEVLDQGFKESSSPNVDALRALSLLSNNSWGLYEPDLIRLDHPQPMGSDYLFMVQPGLQTVPQGLPLSSPDYWQTEQQSVDPSIPALPTKTSNAANTQVQEFQLFSRFYSNPMDEIL